MNLIKLEEVCRLSGVDEEIIIHFIEEDWVHPSQEDGSLMDEEDLARIRLICELKDEFGVNDEGVSIILQLLDQLNRMHLELAKKFQGDDL